MPSAPHSPGPLPDAIQQARRRAAMVDEQLARRDIADRRVLAAMGAVPREQFVRAEDVHAAYRDGPLPIGHGQTISQPYIVALMIQAAALTNDDRVLEIGAGSGYAAAVMSRLCAAVDAVERQPVLAETARRCLAALGCATVTVHVGDGSTGWPGGAPYDAILVAAAAPVVPEALRRQLAVGGRLVVPVGGSYDQRLLRITRTGETTFDEHDLGPVAFVPLIGEQGWPERKGEPS